MKAKKLVFLVSLLVMCGVMGSTAFGENIVSIPFRSAPDDLQFAPNKFIVVLTDEAGTFNATNYGTMAKSGISSLDVLAASYSVDAMRPQFAGAAQRGLNELARYYKVSFSGPHDLQAVMDAYAADPNVDHVEPIGIHPLYATPNDGFYDPYQWYHNQTSDDDIDSPEAWDTQTGSDAMIVAILDSGVRYYHRDLGGANTSPTNEGAARGNMWINNAELNGSSGVDDDGNGYTDDWVGWDFIETTSGCWDGEDCGVQDNDPRDFNGHGTHCSGIVGMLTNNGYGMAGVGGGWGNGTEQEYGNGVKVMACRIGFSYRYGAQEVGVVYMDAAAEAFYYAADNGAKIASCSWGSSNSGGIAAAADYFIANGGLIFTAAGNDGSQTASYLGGRSDVIAVAATDENDGAASFTTYGTWVDISAPGVGIYSTYHDHADPTVDYWASMDGTSMACPMAAATAAMIWSQNPGWTSAQVEQQLYDSAENIDAELSSTYIGKMGAGRINLYDAVNTGEPPPVAEFSGSPTSGCAPLTVNFTDLSTGTITTWDWTFGDGGTSTTPSPSYEYANPGTYTVSLTVTGPTGTDTETKTGYITVSGGPTADFVGSPLTGTAPLTVDFTDLSTDATSWSWDFGDLGTSSAQNPSHQYTNAGTYTVTLTASNACGSDQEVKVNYVVVDPCLAPVADFSGTPTTGTATLSVDFTDLSTNSPTGWDWDFGDGVGTSTAQNPTYNYTAAGDYTVTLTVTNPCGSDGETKIDYIHVDPAMEEQVFALSDIPVLGTVTGDYTNTYAGDNVYEVITETASTGHPVKVTSNLEHKWDFTVGTGTGKTFYVEAYRPNNSDGDNFIFEYSTDDATYLSLVTIASSTEQVYSAAIPDGTAGTVYVRVRDSNRSWGSTSNDPVYIDQMYFQYSTAPAPPVADFGGSPTSGPAPLTVNFTDLSTGSPTSWSWDFGDGVGTSADPNPTYEYTALGQYTVSLTVTNAYGSDNETKIDYINVFDVGNEMYVDNMVVGRRKSGPNYLGTCTVTILDNLSSPVEGATVYVTATGPTGGNYNGVTQPDGTVYFETAGMKKPVGEWCFEVTNVTHASYTYNSAANNVTYACESGWVWDNGGPSAMLVPTEFGLGQNYPNPFNASTTIFFSLREASHVTLDVYNIKGEKVATPVNGWREAGSHHVLFDASRVASGIYFYRLQARGMVETKKMILMK